MCLNCGCGILADNHGDPLNITLSRLQLIASHNESSATEQARNILATLDGKITRQNPLGDDKIEAKLKRIKQETKPKAEYVERTREKRLKAKRD